GPMLRRLTQGVMIAALVGLAARTTAAASLSGGGGADYSSGPRSQSYRGALLFGTVEGTSGDLTLAAIRYDDTVGGSGVGAFANAAWHLAPTARLRAIGLRSFGDDDQRGYRLRGGAELDVSPKVTLSPYYMRIQNDGSGYFDGGGTEARIPLAPSVT